MYTIGNEDYWSYTGTSARAKALKEGAEFCAKQGKRFVLNNSRTTNYAGPAAWGGGVGSVSAAEIVFSCE